MDSEKIDEVLASNQTVQAEFAKPLPVISSISSPRPRRRILSLCDATSRRQLLSALPLATRKLRRVASAIDFPKVWGVALANRCGVRP